jgi:hypothetical protein
MEPKMQLRNSMHTGQRTVGNRHCAVDTGQWTGDREQWVGNSGQWAVNSGNWTLDSGREQRALSIRSS